jgi:hypothetical protein
MSSETSPVAKPRGRPFEKGNSGRPKGARNKTTQAIEQLLEGQAEAITAKVMELALEGNLAALRLCLDRLYSVRNERTISLDLPELTSLADCSLALSAVVAAIGLGEISVGEGEALARLIEATSRTLQAQEVEDRLEELEKRLAENDKINSEASSHARMPREEDGS